MPPAPSRQSERELETAVPGYRVEALEVRLPRWSVLRARDAEGRPVRLTILAAPPRRDDDGGRAMDDLLPRLRALDHPHLVRVLAGGSAAVGPYVVSELEEAVPLPAAMRHGVLDPEGAVWLLAPLADALDHAHHRDVAHGALTPGSILVNEDRYAVLADVGLAELARSGPEPDAAERPFIAPEVLAGGEATPAADIHSLAAVLFWVLTGTDPSGWLERDRPYAAPAGSPAVSLAPELEQVLRRSLADDPGERPRSARALMHQVRHVAVPAPAGLDSRRSRPPAAVPERPEPPRAPAPPVTDELPANERPAATAIPTPAVAPTPAPTPAPPPVTDAGVLTTRLRAPAPPVLAPHHPSSRRRSPRRRSPRRRFGREVVAAVLLMAAAVAAVFALVSSRGEDRPDRPPAAARSVASTPELAVTVPGNWVLAEELLPIDGLPLDESVQVLPPDGRRNAGLLAGVVRETDPGLLPPGFATRVTSPPIPQRTRIGRYDGYRYEGLVLRDGGRRLDLYTVPTAQGAATVACVARQEVVGFLRRCADAARTLELRTLAALPLNPAG